MTKEELQFDAEKSWDKINSELYDKGGVNPYAYTLGFTDAFYKLCEVQKRQEAIAFKEWQDENLEGRTWQQYSGHDDWYNSFTGQVISTEKLYEIFLSQKRK